MIIGLTGQTGAGKSSVSKIFSEKGLFVIDCDKVAREITQKGSKTNEKLASAFGKDVILENGELDRALVAKRAFSNAQNTALLNSITHPEIINSIKEKIKKSDSKYIVLDAPTLFESGADKLCDKVICVIADKEIRVKRIAERDNLSFEQINARISAQKEDEFYINRSDAVIYNNSDFVSLEGCTNDALNKIGVK